MLESEIKKNCKKKLEQWGWLVVHIIQTNMNGWPDTQLFRKGQTLFIEFKQPGKEPEELQLYRHRKLREQGFETRIVHSLDEIKDLE